MANREQNDEQQTTAEERTRSNRRSLLKASAAAPVVATLQTGSAWAMASTIQCVVQDAAQPDRPDDTGEFERATDDGWVRQAVNKWYVRNASNIPKILYDVDGNGRDGILYNANGDPKNGSSFTDDPNFATNPETVYVVTAFEPQGSPVTNATDEGSWPKNQFDNVSHQPLTDSCWTSVMDSHGI